jgi:hypothetical protein
MQKILPFLLLFVFSSNLIYGQIKDNFTTGSATELSGDIYNLSCFVSGEDEEWTPIEKSEILKKVKEAENWLIQQANKKSIPLNFKEGCFGLQSDIKLEFEKNETGELKRRKNLVSLVLEKMRYENSLQMYNWVLSKTYCKQLQVLIFIKGKARNYSIIYDKLLDKDKYFVESSIFYEKSISKANNPIPLKTASIAHEILHLYGAWDLYETQPTGQSKANAERANKLFYNSIMLGTPRNMKDLYIDEITEWLIGWNKNEKTWYLEFRPVAYDRL